MEKTYKPQAIEQHWYQTWEQNNYFAPSGTGTPYSIMIPPPNVTGSLHMGHAFSDTIQDTLIRYHRMKGDNTLWQVGTDHAGIATQMVVERQLLQQGSSRLELGREKFLEKVWDWKQESGGTITQQLRRMGASVDWDRERFTMDEGMSKAVSEVFVKLYEEDLIYRGQRLVNWDPKLHTAISDLEVVSTEENGHFWHMRYDLADGSGHLVVATTRPETMLGDTAVAVHPEDPRFKDYIGKKIKLPLCDRTIPIIADDYVDPEFGTGCVKITPAHDFNDYEMGKRHNLPMINILTIDAAINDNAPQAYQGLDRFEARKKVVADLEALGLLVKIEPHRLKVPRGDRSGEVVEPYLTDQWYVAVDSLAKPAIEAVENGDIEFVPKNWENTYFAWMRDLQDWCISRQLWWGHRIPAWYDEQGKIYVGQDEQEVRSKHQLGPEIKLRQDEDVLDTWFSSALWTFSTLGWPENTDALKTFHSTDVLVTGFDIIFFWVARMIMMTLKFTGEVPFKTVYIHGLVRDSDGQKMSKSKGNVLDPLDLIDGIELDALLEKRTAGLMQPKMKDKIIKATRKHYPDGIEAYGTDALRFTFCSLASTGRDVQFDLNRAEGYRNFCNKIWNAARYVLMNTEAEDCGQDSSLEYELSTADEWIVSRLQHVEKEFIDALDQFRLDHASQTLYDFVWNEYCDWYLELSKPLLNSDASPEQKRGTRRTLVRVLETILRLSHPMMPFISEEIWQRIAPLAGIDLAQNPSLMLQRFPVPASEKINLESEADIQWIKGVIIGIRNIRGEMNISPAKALPVFFNNGSDSDQARLKKHQSFLQSLAKIASITWLTSEDTPPPAATQLVEQLEILVPLAGFIDKDAEIARLSKEITKLEKDLQRIEGKLSNQKFIDKAPADIIEKERQKAAQVSSAKEKLKHQKEKIALL